MTSESESKLKQVYSNIKNFYILDADKFIKSLDLDMSKQSSVYIANDEIKKIIISQSKLKKYKGIIYINKHLSDDLYQSFKVCLSKYDAVRIMLIDNGQFPKHEDIMGVFDEVLFYERFKKNRIIDCNGFEKKDNVISNIIMDENNI